MSAGVLAEIVNLHHVVMCQLGGSVGFSREPRQRRRIVRQPTTDGLQSDQTIERNLLRFVDGTHRASTEQPQDPVPSEAFRDFFALARPFGNLSTGLGCFAACRHDCFAGLRSSADAALFGRTRRITIDSSLDGRVDVGRRFVGVAGPGCNAATNGGLARAGRRAAGG